MQTAIMSRRSYSVNSCNKTSKTDRKNRIERHVQYYGVCMCVCMCGRMVVLYVCVYMFFFKYMFVCARYVHSNVHDRNKNLYIKIYLLLLTGLYVGKVYFIVKVFVLIFNMNWIYFIETSSSSNS